ncbi:hypothetical protein BDN72DRAFT_896083 [Pluteus cervinus]|uniref:Uncharacterized protein n=1 Tax=Pluteus cervinus TaxID=181527 RepID=A0ACD3AZQ4_9AGAR|nr:hypothetical protein BDN72DRAFT_896083 [Pluteus cervinus]
MGPEAKELKFELKLGITRSRHTYHPPHRIRSRTTPIAFGFVFIFNSKPLQLQTNQYIYSSVGVRFESRSTIPISTYTFHNLILITVNNGLRTNPRPTSPHSPNHTSHPHPPEPGQPESPPSIPRRRPTSIPIPTKRHDDVQGTPRPSIFQPPANDHAI